MKEYYPFLFSLYSKDYYCIWYTDDKDGFLAGSNRILIFQSQQQLYFYAKENNLIFQDDITGLSVDIAVDWLKKESNNIDCKYFLDFWNIIGDLAYSVHDSFYGNGENDLIIKVYNKLFYGNNLPSIKGDGEDYYPTWSKEEVDVLILVVKDGLRIVNTCFTR